MISNGISEKELTRRAKISASLMGIKRAPFTKDHRDKISNARKGQIIIHSEETKRKIGLGNKGKLRSEAQRKIMSEIRKGKVISKEHREKLSKAGKGRICSEETRKKIGLSNKGKIRTEEFLIMRSNIQKTKIGLLSPNWQNGKSFEPYSRDWTKQLKQRIKERDAHTCQICLGEGKDVHHIDYNKKNCDELNLITLCTSCHAKTNFRRAEWVQYFACNYSLV